VVEVVRTAADALRVAKERARAEQPPFSVVLLDLGLPDRPGDTIVKELRGLLSDTAVVLVLSSREGHAKRVVEDEGVDAFLPKPLRPTDTRLFRQYLYRRTQRMTTQGLLVAETAAHEECLKKYDQRQESVWALRVKNNTLLKELTEIGLDADEYEARLGASQNMSRRRKEDVVRAEAQLKVAQKEIQQLRATPPRAAPPVGFRPVAPVASTWQTSSRPHMRGDQKIFQYCKDNRDRWIEWLGGQRMKSRAVDPARFTHEIRRAFWEETHQL
jgi:DNA-binding response OmpR family regulator